MLESAKDQILVVDTPGQQVLPRVRYGMTCLLIRDAVECMPSSDEWELECLLLCYLLYMLQCNELVLKVL
jgi:hypothetical protein